MGGGKKELASDELYFLSLFAFFFPSRFLQSRAPGPVGRDRRIMNAPDATITFPENWVLAPGGARLSGAFVNGRESKRERIACHVPLSFLANWPSSPLVWTPRGPCALSLSTLIAKAWLSQTIGEQEERLDARALRGDDPKAACFFCAREISVACGDVLHRPTKRPLFPNATTGHQATNFPRRTFRTLRVQGSAGVSRAREGERRGRRG